MSSGVLPSLAFLLLCVSFFPLDFFYFFFVFISVLELIYCNHAHRMEDGMYLEFEQRSLNGSYPFAVNLMLF